MVAWVCLGSCSVRVLQGGGQGVAWVFPGCYAFVMVLEGIFRSIFLGGCQVVNAVAYE